MQAQLNIALRAAREGAVNLVRQFDRLDRIQETKGPGNSRISSAHTDVEFILLEHLRKTYPKHGFRSGATGLDENPEADTIWLINPLIGTENFFRGRPGFVLGLACQVNKQIKVAVFIDPLLNEEFTAVRGGGANVSGRRLRVTQNTELEDCMVCVEFNRDQEHNETAMRFQQHALNGGGAISTSGNGIISLLAAAAGRLDGGLIPRPESIELDPAILLLREAGGLISDSSGNPALSGNSLIFGNPKLFKQLLKLTD